jgi:ketosteroid isomerase-like protein
MPTPPDVGVLTRFVLENPWPLAGLLLVVAVVLAWTGLREGATGRLKAALVPALAGAAALAAGTLVTTSGERATAVVRGFVTAVEETDLVAAANAIAEDGSIGVASVNNPGFGKDYIITRLDRLGGRFAITSNRITQLDAYTISPDEAEVHLGVRTETDRGMGPALTRWVIRVRRQDDGEWRIQRQASAPIPPLGRLVA